jgi:hypothetical protein
MNTTTTTRASRNLAAADELFREHEPRCSFDDEDAALAALAGAHAALDAGSAAAAVRLANLARSIWAGDLS